jgi:hypothetical protein
MKEEINSNTDPGGRYSISLSGRFDVDMCRLCNDVTRRKGSSPSVQFIAFLSVEDT